MQYLTFSQVDGVRVGVRVFVQVGSLSGRVDRRCYSMVIISPILFLPLQLYAGTRSPKVYKGESNRKAHIQAFAHTSQNLPHSHPLYSNDNRRVFANHCEPHIG